MGGNAFAEAKRLTRSEYEAICKEVESAAARCGVKGAVPQSCRDKMSFGDVDLVVSRDSIDSIHDLINHLQPKALIKHPNGYNLLMSTPENKLYQLDLNLVAGDSFVFSYWYFSYNDLGNLIGRIAHHQGLKFGHDGLWDIIS